MANYSLCELNTQRVFEISEALWQKNCDEKHLLLRYLAIPVQETADKIWLAIDDENNLNACEIFAFMTHKQIEPILVASDELKYLLNALSPEPSLQANATDICYTEQQPQDSALNLSDPIIQLLDNLFKFCLSQNASDIHIEPHKTKLIIRLRIDGVLHIYKALPSHLAPRIISRLKLLAKLDISESRLPQDGQFSFTTALAETLDVKNH